MVVGLPYQHPNVVTMAPHVKPYKAHLNVIMASSRRAESAQREETEPTMKELTTSYMPNVLTTPTNVPSPILAAGPSTIPTAYSTALESTQDDNSRQPTSQMNEPDVTPSLFSPITMEPTTIPETPSIYETSIDRTTISPQSDQLSSDCRSSERKNMEGSLSYRQRHRVQSRLNDRSKMTSELAVVKGSEDKELTNIACSVSRPSRHKDRHCSKDRRQMRTSSEDLSRRHKKKTGSHRVQIQAPSEASSSSAEDYVDMIKLTHLMKSPKYGGTSASTDDEQSLAPTDRLCLRCSGN